jgi:uncharacterized protein (DUF983 family)
MNQETTRTPLFMAGISCRCPRCGAGDLFAGFLKVAPSCENCGLDYSFADAGDGPAVFVVLFTGLIVATVAVIVEFVYRPPYWVHAVVWAPLILVISLNLLRPAKGLLIALQYRHMAEEGRPDRP